MDDPSLVGRFERRRDLPRDRQCLIDGNRPLRDAVGQCRSVDQLQNERLHAMRFFETVNCGDMWVVQRRQHLRLTLEARDAIEISGEEFRKDLQCDIAIELRVMRAIDLAHPARAENGADLVKHRDACRQQGAFERLS